MILRIASIRSFGFLLVMFVFGGVRKHATGSLKRSSGLQTSVIDSCYAFASHAQDRHHRGHFARSSGLARFKRFGPWEHPEYLPGNHFIPRGGSSSSFSSSTSATSLPLPPSPQTPLHASTQSQNADTPSKSLSDRAQESLAIAGETTPEALKYFGGLRFRDTFAEKESFRVIFVLGGPGAGKGTQCELLKQNYPCVHLSAGQLLREEAAKKDESQHAALIEECLVAGKIVPVEISLELLRNAMKASEARSVLFLIDGFPRNFDNLEGWTRVMANGGDAAAVWGVLSYDCPLSILEKRVMERSKESGRSDDNLDSLRRRFQTFQAETVPVVDILRLIENDTLLKVVDIAGDQSLEKVWEDTQKTMNTFIANDILSANVRLLEAVTRRDVDVYRNLCADEMFVDVHNDESGALLSAEQIFVMQEGTEDSELISSNIKCAEMTFVTGEKVSLSYDRTLPSGVSFKETRIWSHQGPKGWRMVHFSRAAIP